MKAIFVDLESNQPSDKIIQIGAVCTNLKSHEIIGSFNMICNPEGELPSQFITELTGITQEQVKNGVPLNQALVMFWDWVEKCNCAKRIYEWGNYDSKMLVQQSKERGVESPRLKILNVKEMATALRMAKGQSAKGGLKNTAELFGINFVGENHNALADAFITALIYFKLQQMLEFAESVERAHGNIKIRNFDQTVEKFLDLYRQNDGVKNG